MVLASDIAIPALTLPFLAFPVPPMLNSVDSDLLPLTVSEMVCERLVDCVSGIGDLVLLVVEMVPTGAHESFTLYTTVR